MLGPIMRNSNFWRPNERHQYAVLNKHRLYDPALSIIPYPSAQDSSTEWEDLALSRTWRIINQTKRIVGTSVLEHHSSTHSLKLYRITERVGFTAERETETDG